MEESRQCPAPRTRYVTHDWGQLPDNEFCDTCKPLPVPGFDFSFPVKLPGEIGGALSLTSKECERLTLERVITLSVEGPHFEGTTIVAEIRSGSSNVRYDSVSGTWDKREWFLVSLVNEGGGRLHPESMLHDTTATMDEAIQLAVGFARGGV